MKMTLKFLKVNWDGKVAYYLLYHFPHLQKRNLKSNFDNFQWLDDKKISKSGRVVLLASRLWMQA